jgi:hypothetical protein
LKCAGSEIGFFMLGRKEVTRTVFIRAKERG